MGRFAAVAVAAFCGIAAAALYLAVMLDSPGGLILVYLTQLPLFVAGLWLGAGAAALAGLVGALVMLGASDLLAAALFAGLNAAPVVLLVRQALLARRQPDGTLRWYPPGLLTAWLTAIAVAGLALSLVLIGGPDALQAALRDIIGRALDRIAPPGLAGRDVVVGALATVIPGIVAASWMMMAVINGSLAQGLLSRFGASWRPSPDPAALVLPFWIPLLLAAATVATLVGGSARFIGINLMIALAVPIVLAGLAVLHAAARRLAHPAAALILFYTLAALFGWPLLVIAILGLCENWLGLRRRFAPPGEPIDD